MLQRSPLDELRSDELLDAQRHVLEMIVRGSELSDVLTELCLLVERQAGRPVRAAILLVDADGERLFTAAAPSLPEAYNRAVDGIAIAPDVGTCCAAAARGEAVVTRDFATDPAWEQLRHLPLEQGLKAAWSMPILSSTGSVLGTFGTYFSECCEPRAQERRLVEVLASTAALAIERQRADELLRSTGSRHRFLAELATATQPLADPADVLATTARMVAEQLGVDRCAYAEVENEQVFVITGDYGPDVPSIVGRHSVASFGPGCVRQMRRGEPFVVHDVEAHREIGHAYLPAYRATDIGAVICVPLHKDGRFTAAMAVHQRTARRWSPADIELLSLVVGRCWEALQRTVAARALEANRARLDYAVRLSGVGFWYCDLPFDELIWDERVRAHFFISRDARVTLETFYERIHPDDRAHTRAAIDDSIRDKLSYDVVYRTVDPSTAAIKWVRALGGTAYAADGTPVRFDGVTVDVTSQKLDQERLSRAFERERDQARLLEKVAHAALVIHGASSLEGVLHAVTAQARSIIGAHQAMTHLSAGDERSQSSSVVSLSEKYGAPRDPLPAPRDLGLYAAVVQTNRPMRMSQQEIEAHPAWRALAVDASHHPPLRGWLAAPMVGHHGANLGMIQLSDRLEGEFNEVDEAILVQLAQIAAVAIENARLYDQLREQDQRKSEFLATLAHELRNPLAPIRTGMQVLRSEPSPAQLTKAHEMMERQLGHMVHMVDDLLDISRVTLGKVTLQKQRVDFRSVLRSALETTRPLIDAAQHELSVSLPDCGLPLDGDPTRLAQVFANLLNNAAKYTPHGGRIALTAELAQQTLIVRVGDTGMGIPADMIASVFEMFTQVGRTIERAQGGLGIGLTLVRRLVEMHGGVVDAASPGVGLGTTFTVRLPLAEQVLLNQTAPAAAASERPAALRVLVVDDNFDAAESLAMLLEMSGHQTALAHTGPDAVATTLSFEPDVVFLDIGLPELNGYEVAKRIRADTSIVQPMLIALTGWGSEDDRRQAQVAGFDRHLVKPFDASKLDELLSARTTRVRPK